MGCCSTKDSSEELQFKGYPLYDLQNTSRSEHKRLFKSSCNLTDEYSSTDKFLSQGNEESPSKPPQTAARDHKSQPNINQSCPGTTLFPAPPSQYKRIEHPQDKYKNTAQNVLKPSHSDNLPPLPPTELKHKPALNFAQFPPLRVRFGPLTSIQEEESQIGQTARLSQASRMERSNHCKPSPQE